MTDQENLQIARKVFEAWNAHDPNRYVALLDQGHVWEADTLPQTVRGRDAARHTMQMYMSAFPDLHFDIEQMMAGGQPRGHPLAGHRNPSGRAAGRCAHPPAEEGRTA